MLMKTTGCELIETKQCPFSNFKKNFVRYAKKLARKEKGFYVDQFFNTINSKTHYEETGPEIYRDLNGEIDCFVSSAGIYEQILQELEELWEGFQSTLRKRIKILKFIVLT